MTIYNDIRLYLERRRPVVVTRNSFGGDGHGDSDRGRPFDSTWRLCTGDDSCCSCCSNGCVYDEWLRAVRLDDSYYSGHVLCIRARWTTDCYCATRGCRIWSRARVFCFAAPRRIVVAAVHTRASNTGTGVFIFQFYSQKLCATTTTTCVFDKSNAHAEESTTGLDFGWLVLWWCSAPEPTNAIVTPTIIIGTRHGRWRIHPTAVPRDSRDLADSDPPARQPSHRRRVDATTAV